MKKIILLIILVIVIAGGFIGYRMYSEQTPDIVDKKADVAITVTALIAAFEKDTAEASRTYLNKVIEVTGNVKRIDTTGTIVMGDESHLSEVIVGLDRRHMEDYKKLSVGATAVLQGICSGYSSGSGDDLLASLGTNVELRSGGVKKKK